MLTLYRTLSLRFLQERWSRALLVMASIAIGVGTLVATRALNQSIWGAARTAANPLAGSADLYISNGDSGVQRTLADEVARVPGVQDVEPVVVSRARLPDLGERGQAQVLGIVWKAESTEHNPWNVTIEWTISPASVPGLKGTDPQAVLAFLKKWKFQPVLVGEDLAAELKRVTVDARLNPLFDRISRDLADKLKATPVWIQTLGQKPQLFFNVGTVRAAGPAGQLIKNALIMNAADAAELRGQPDLVTRVDLFLEPGAEPGRVRDRVQEVVDGKAAVRTAGESDELVQQTMAGMQLGFSLSGAGALVIGLLLVYMVLAVSVAERRHEIGILRSLGATRGQVWGLFVGEAGLLGLAGVALGVPAGLALAHFLGLNPTEKVITELVVPLKDTRLEVRLDTVLLAAAAGVATAVLAALVPAVQAAREQPASAVRGMPPLPGWTHWLLLGAITAALLFAGTAGIFWRRHLPERWGTYGGFVLVLLGMLLTTPLLSAGLARLLQPVARWSLGISGRLAADNLVRAPARTGLVITVLAGGVAMFIQSAGVIRSNEDPIRDWMYQTRDAELVVAAGSPVTGSGQNLPLPENLGREFQEAVAQVDSALPVRLRTVDYGDNMVLLAAVDAPGMLATGRNCGPGTARTLFPKLGPPGSPQALVSENFAALYRVRDGDTISLRGPHGPIHLRVVGTVADFNFCRGTILLDRELYRRQFDDPLVDAYYVYLAPRADPQEVRDQLLQRWGAEYALVVLTQGELRKDFDNLVRTFSQIAYSQEVVIGLVAALGVVTALLISVLQRRRELGILRAVGATQGQVLRTVLAEAVLMGVIGTVIGLAVGVPVEWYCIQVILFEETGFLFPVRIPWEEAGLIALGAVSLATLAGLIPAMRTLHLRIPEAIAYE
jgi:putative ABC transport system permease protein